ncbi:uncharacterized protein LOC105225958 [Bactrocera dorsalis]|uniref:Uncharacterized protein LOC105225958 n=1 Tax=Bactrocera dorsalis TaxID=27457 RepID=A0A9B2GWW7_BACDO|nr:uncharacterized protein LOC105225958 [Bactrocera dorsalis]
MTEIIKIASIAFLAFCCLVQANYVPGVSYIENVELAYDNVTDIWRCDQLVCPPGTLGCKIIKRNNPNKADELICNNICYDKLGANLLKFTHTESMVQAQTIDIYVNSYVDGDIWQWSVGYSLSWQGLNATIAPQDWPRVQESMRSLIKAFDDSYGASQRVIRTFKGAH